MHKENYTVWVIGYNGKGKPNSEMFSCWATGEFSAMAEAENAFILMHTIKHVENDELIEVPGRVFESLGL